MSNAFYPKPGERIVSGEHLDKVINLPQCNCLPSEKESGHVSWCWFPEFLEAVGELFGKEGAE